MEEIAGNPTSPAPQPKRKPFNRWLIFGIAVVILAVGGVFGWRAFLDVRQKRIVEKARSFLEKKDYGQALIATQWALQVNPRNVEVNRMMAELAEVADSSQAVFWHRAVTELEPGVLENHLKWAESGLRHNSPAMAEQALASVPQDGKRTAAFHEMAGRVAQAQNQTESATAHFAEAAKIEPQNEKYQIALAAVRVESPEPAVRDEARAEIARFKEKPEYRRQACRLLIQDHFRHNQWKEGFLVATELQATPDALFEDRMLLLDLLRKFNRPELHAYLMDLQDYAVRNPENVATLVTWLNRNTMALVAADWSKRLPEDVRTRNPVPAAIAESYANLKNWPVVKTMVVEGNWDYSDFMRLALFARALREEGDQLGSRNQWNNAVRAASARPEALEQLTRFAAASKWDAESMDLLWQVARGKSNPQWALAALQQEYASKRNARGMLNVAARQLELDSGNIPAQNNVASFSLLLNMNVERAVALARGAYRKLPENPIVATTYGFAMHTAGNTEEGLKIYRSIPKEVLREPSVAVCYAVLLAYGGSIDEAAEYLDLAEQGSLFAEERDLVAKTRGFLKERAAGQSAARQ
jgi:tetratricopeptide (TPR) repeat protein